MAERENLNRIRKSIIGAAIEVHRALGPGLLESAYQACLTFERAARGLKVERQKPLPVIYREVMLDSGYRLDILVEQAVIVEVKVLKDGIRRMVNDFPHSLRSQRSLR